jgi:hypothetical protein
MPSTPKSLVDALDVITAKRPKAAGAVPESLSLHRKRVRAAFEDPNIVAVGISEKRTEGEKTGDLCVCFYVVKKKPLRIIKPESVVPPVIAAPNGAAVFTDVKAIGRVLPERSPKVHKESAPLRSGYSICHYDDTAGTLGAIVRRGGKLYALSNSHVLALAGKAKAGDAILYPGPTDGGVRGRDSAAVLKYFAKFKDGGSFVNRVDAALAEIDKARLSDIDFEIAGANIPLKAITPQRGMKIVKFGHTSGRTVGEVEDVHFRVVIPYEGVGDVGFLDQVQCTRYTKPGDSGAMVVDQKSGGIVGLHFSGSDSASIFTPIQYVMDELKFTFANG